MRQLQQSTASEPLTFLMVQSADHITGLTGASPTVTLSKNGAAFASPSGAVSEIANGWYKVAANATDTNTLGDLLLHATATSGDPTDIQYQVVGYNPLLANLATNPVLLNGQTLTVGGAVTVSAGTLASTTNITAGTLTLVTTATNLTNNTPTAGTITLVGTTTNLTNNTPTGGTIALAQTLTTYTGNTPQTGDAFLRIGAAGASLTNIQLSGNQTFNINGSLSGAIGGTNAAGQTFITQGTGANQFSLSGGVGKANQVQLGGITAGSNVYLGLAYPTVLGLTELGNDYDSGSLNINHLYIYATDANPAVSISNSSGPAILVSGTTQLQTTRAGSAISIQNDDAENSTIAISNAGGIPINADFLAAFVTEDTGQTSAVAGSVAQLSQAQITAPTNFSIMAIDHFGKVTPNLPAPLGVQLTSATNLDGTHLPTVGSGTNQILLSGGGLVTSTNGGGGGSLTGPSSVTLTFHDGSGNGVPGVYYTLLAAGVPQGSAQANASGVGTFSFTDGTYTVAGGITNGIVFPSTTLMISGTTTLTITGTAPTIPSPPSANEVVAYGYTTDPAGNAVAGQLISYQLITPPTNATGAGVFDHSIQSLTSGTGTAAGIFSFDAAIGGTYQYWRFAILSPIKQQVTIPTGASTPFPLPNI